MNRKDFLIAASLSAFSISAFGKLEESGSGFKADCETTNDILGPFYRPDAPTRNDLTDKNIQGTLIQIKGKVYEDDCITPIANAMVEIWHCNTKGEYDNKSKDYQLRAKWYTDENGEYSFKTILPGKYLNGKLYRPAHVHYRVTADNSKDLISQLYFKGDPHITDDPWASKEAAEHRILPIVLEDTKGNLAVNFDIYLKQKS